MNDSMHPEIEGYVSPSAEELKARSKRNIAIGLGLVAFVLFVVLLTLSRLGAFG